MREIYVEGSGGASGRLIGVIYFRVFIPIKSWKQMEDIRLIVGIYSIENDEAIFLSIIPLEEFGQQSYIQDQISEWLGISMITSSIFMDCISLSLWCFIKFISPEKTIPQFGRLIRKARSRERRYFIEICLFTSSDIPGTNELFDKGRLLWMVTCKLGRSTTCKVMLEKFTIHTLEESHTCIHLMCDICTIGILFDEFFDFFECSESLLEIELELGFVGIHIIS